MRYLAGHPYFAIHEIDIAGNRRVETQRIREVLGRLGMVEGSSIWRVTPSRAESALRAEAPLRGVRVERVFPRRISVRVRERVPWGIVRFPEGMALVDVGGNPFEFDPGETAALPIVSVGEPMTVFLARPDRRQLLREAVRVARLMESGAGGMEVSEVALTTLPAGGPSAAIAGHAAPAKSVAGSPRVIGGERGSLGAVAAGDARAPDAKVTRLARSADCELTVYREDGRLAVRMGWGGWRTKARALELLLRQPILRGAAGALDLRDPLTVVFRPSAPIAADLGSDGSSTPSGSRPGTGKFAGKSGAPARRAPASPPSTPRSPRLPRAELAPRIATLPQAAPRVGVVSSLPTASMNWPA